MSFPVFDLHCDTVTRLIGRDLKGETSLRRNDFHIDLERAKTLPGYTQCFGFWSTTDLPLPRGIKIEEVFWTNLIWNFPEIFLSAICWIGTAISRTLSTVLIPCP